jgi:hypothetical protein
VRNANHRVSLAAPIRIFRISERFSSLGKDNTLSRPTSLKMNEVYLPPMSAALQEKPDSPVKGISPGKQA